MALVHVDWHPSERHLRGFGTACVAVFGALGALALWRHAVLGLTLGPESAPRVALACWALAAICGALRLLAPTWLRPLYVGLTAATLPIGMVMGHVVVGIVFFGVVTPIALIFRAVGGDPLQRAFDRNATSYWTRRRPVTDLASYYRQY